MLNVYIANLGKYNEGELVGKWLELPATENDIYKLFAEIKLGYFDEDGEYHHGYEEGLSYYEEYAIHDYETDIEGLKIREYEDIFALNDLIEQYENLAEYDKEKVNAAIEAFGYSLEKAIEKVDNFEFYADIKDEYDLGYYWAVESGCYTIDEKNPLSRYIDYEAFGRDIRIENGGCFVSGGYVEELY